MYRLVDFGNERKLEQFGGLLIDRPSPVATVTPSTHQWQNADAVFRLKTNHKGSWKHRTAIPEPWLFSTGFGAMELFTTEFGHLGIFAEQIQNWRWLQKQKLDGLRLLNLFAYTGGSTLAAAAAGAAVTHVDSAKNIVGKARRNAEHSKLQDHPIRWIIEDAAKFVEREVRRGNQYDGVIMDPPTYGHGVTSKTTWKIEDDLPILLDGLQQIIPRCKLMLFTCHSAGFTTKTISKMLLPFSQTALPKKFKPETGTMILETEDGRRLPSGNFVRWFSSSNVS